MSLLLVAERQQESHGIKRCKVILAVMIAALIELMPISLMLGILSRLMRGVRESDTSETSTARAEVCGASARCLGEGCLRRSIAVVVLCRMDGHCPTWKSGYQVNPFRAHAWVEVDGTPVDEPEEVESYIVTLDQHPYGGHQDRGCTGMLQAVRSELKKILTLLTPILAVILTVTLTITLSGFLTFMTKNAFEQGHPEQMAGLEPASAFLAILYYGQVGSLFIGSWLVIEEQGHGNLRTTYLAIPQRQRVYVAKAIVVAFVATLMGLLSVFGSYAVRTVFVGDALIGDVSIPNSRILWGYVLYGTLISLVTYGLSSLLRNGIGGLCAMLCAILIASPLLLSKTQIARFLADQAGSQMYMSTLPTGTDLGPTYGLVVMLAWVMLLNIAGCISQRAASVCG